MFKLEWRNGSSAKPLTILEGQPITASDAEMVWYDLAPSDETFELLGRELRLTEYWLRRCEKNEIRSKAEEVEEYLYLTLPKVTRDAEGEIDIHAVHIFLGRTQLISIHHDQTPEMQELADHMPSRVAAQGPDILLYLIADSLLDPVFGMLDEIAEAIDELEEQILTRPDNLIMDRFFHLKHDLLLLRKGYSPMREVFTLLAREEKAMVDPEILPYMAELYDRVVRLQETIDLHRDLVSSATEIYLSTISNRMNEKMTTLTIVSTVILPLTLIVGYYGMNFQYFPELKWHLGMGFLWFLMVMIVGLMLYFFKKKRWF